MRAPERSSDPIDASEPALIDARYRVINKIGRGGAAAVYAVDDESTGRRLALKCLSLSASHRLHTMFKREFFTLSGIQHPNIVEVYEFGRHAGAPYYTMELLEGSDLHARTPVSFDVALHYVREAAKALSVLHARHLVHRDITARNLWRSLSQSSSRREHRGL